MAPTVLRVLLVCAAILAVNAVDEEVLLLAISLNMQ